MAEKTNRYRAMVAGERIQEGDEFRVKGAYWEPVFWSIGEEVSTKSQEEFRRPIPDLWAPTQSHQAMPDGPGETEAEYKAKLGTFSHEYAWKILRQHLQWTAEGKDHPFFYERIPDDEQSEVLAEYSHKVAHSKELLQWMDQLEASPLMKKAKV